MKKALLFYLAVACLLTGLCACDNTPTILKTAMSEGDFIYNLNDDGSGTAVILGFTEEGLQKEALIVPETIGGYPVRNYNIDLAFTPLGEMKHDSLKRIYFPYEIDIASFAFNNNTQLEKVFILRPSSTKTYNKATVYYPRIVESPSSNYANITYLSDETIYWIDDYEYGTKILFQPPEPVRSDAVFEGWYKEATCSTPWNFDLDTLPASANESNNHYQYQEIILYAKWNKEGSNP